MGLENNVYYEFYSFNAKILFSLIFGINKQKGYVTMVIKS